MQERYCNTTIWFTLQREIYAVYVVKVDSLQTLLLDNERCSLRGNGR